MVAGETGGVIGVRSGSRLPQRLSRFLLQVPRWVNEESQLAVVGAAAETVQIRNPDLTQPRASL
jgi:hypothetical protein